LGRSHITLMCSFLSLRRGSHMDCINARARWPKVHREGCRNPDRGFAIAPEKDRRSHARRSNIRFGGDIKPCRQAMTKE
jgi:hypothetical protein